MQKTLPVSALWIRLRFIGATILFLTIVLVAFLSWKILAEHPFSFASFQLHPSFILFVVAGFVAQLIDGALGMAYGISCTSLLLGFGLPPALASASVHTAEVFSTGASGLSHLYFRNIDKKLFLQLTGSGVLGAMLGAYLLSDVFDGKLIKPYVSLYLLSLGCILFWKGWCGTTQPKPIKNLRGLGFIGGLLDSIGGGGWGPIVTSNLLRKGGRTKETIGTINTVEFFVSYFSTGVFLMFVDIQVWQPICGLVIGGILAAPLAAWVLHKLQQKLILLSVGTLVVLVSIYNLLKSLI